MVSASKKLLKELPADQRMNEIMSDLKSYGPQATAIMGGRLSRELRIAAGETRHDRQGVV